MKCLESLAVVLLRHPKCVLVGWLAFAVFSACFAMKLVDSCRFQFDPIPNTPSFEAQARFEHDFPRALYADVEIVLISCSEKCSSVLDVPFAKQVATKLSQKCKALDGSNQGLMVNWTDAFEFAGSGAARLPGAAPTNPYLSASKQTALFELTWQVKPGEQAETQAMLEDIQHVVNELNEQGGRLSSGPAVGVMLTGSLALFSETLEATKSDVETRDGFILPWALLVLLYRIRSGRLLLIPGFCLAITIATSFTLFLPFAYFRVVDISPFCPTAMLFLSLALSIDYSLFLLTRFVDEVKAGADTEAAVKTMMSQSGHVVGVSGCVLVICYTGVLFFPSDEIRTVGFGAAIAIVMCIATNLTITPAAIACFPKFFTPKVATAAAGRSRARSWFADRWVGLRRRRGSEEQHELEAPISASPEPSATGSLADSSTVPSPKPDELLEQGRLEPGASGSPAPPIPRRRCWIWIADLVTKFPGNILVPIVVLGLLIPPATQIFKYKESFANSLTFPRHGQATDAYLKLGGEFPASILAPVYLLQPTGLEDVAELSELHSALRADAAVSHPHSLPAPGIKHPHFQFPHLSAAMANIGPPTRSRSPICDRLSNMSAATNAAMEAHFDSLCLLSQRLLGHLGYSPFDVKAQHLTGLATLPGDVPSVRGVGGGGARSAGDVGSDLACLHWNSTKLDEVHKFPVSGKQLLCMGGDIGESYREMYSRLMSDNGASSMVVLAPPFDPYGELLRTFIHHARDALAAEQPGQGEAALLLSSVAIVVDIVEVAYERFPYILGGTILLVFSLIAFAFKAALAPLKMFFTVVVPLTAVFGIAIWIYQEGGLEFLHVGALASPPGSGFYWGTPIFTCTIVIGLALDYDVFLFARVVELRKQGFDNVSAIRGAVFLTGPIITSAGMIMAIALGGLLLCDVPSNNQVGFVLTFGVLVDTFVIRICLVPAVLALASKANYWPQRLPEPTKGNDDLAQLFVAHSAAN